MRLEGRTSNIYKSKKVWAIVLLSVVVFAAISWFIDLRELKSQVAQLPAWLVITALMVLPLFGVPVTFLYIVLGARFGAWLGMGWSAVAVAFHLTASYWIAHTFMHDPLQRWLSRSRCHLPKAPQGEVVSVCLWASLVPGVPYALKNYLLALSDVSFKPYLLVCLPSHVIHATLGIIFGHFSDSLTPSKIVYIVLYALVLAYLTRRIMKALKVQEDPDEAVLPESARS